MQANPATKVTKPKPIPKQQLAVPEPSVAQMLNAALVSIQSGQVTAEHVQVAREMMELYREHQKDVARKAYVSAFVELQAKMKRVKAVIPVDPKPDGTCRYKIAKFEQIMEEAQPILTEHGFAVSFDTQEGDHRMTTTMTIMHHDGHSEQNRFAVRYTKPPGANDAQGDTNTNAYGKRAAFCNGFNIVIDHEDDARMESLKTITQDEADDLRQRVRECEGDEKAFLALAGVAHYEAITEDRLDTLLRAVERKERQFAARKKEREVTEPHERDSSYSSGHEQEPEQKNAEGEFEWH